MDNSLTQFGQSSPFDALRQTDEHGNEYWRARDLQVPFGYSKWENFEEAFEKAIASRKNIGQNPDLWILEVRKPITSGKGRIQEIKDYRLNRPGAYLVAMNCDGRKPEISAAQNYFVAKILEAELAIAQAKDLDPIETARNPQMLRQAVEQLEDIALAAAKKSQLFKLLEQHYYPEQHRTRGKRQLPQARPVIWNNTQLTQLTLLFGMV
jgi:DNA-damage-inducible protein D